MRIIAMRHIFRSSARLAVLVYLALILLFTFLLSLPLASATGEASDFIDAFFTAVSVICVTGLATVDMASHWSGFGHEHWRYGRAKYCLVAGFSGFASVEFAGQTFGGGGH